MFWARWRGREVAARCTWLTSPPCPPGSLWGGRGDLRLWLPLRSSPPAAWDSDIHQCHKPSPASLGGVLLFPWCRGACQAHAARPAANRQPAWTALDLYEQSQACRVRIRSLAPLKFKLMLLSLIFISSRAMSRPTPVAAFRTPAVRDALSLSCFGITETGHAKFALNGRVRATAPWGTLSQTQQGGQSTGS